MILGPDGNIWFSRERTPNRIAKNHAGRPHHRIRRRHLARRQTAVDCGARRRAVVLRGGAGNRIGRITVDGAVTEFPIPSHDSQPARLWSPIPDGSIWFVETSTNAPRAHRTRQGRITEHPVPTPNASLRGVTVGRRWRPLVHRELANKIGLHGARGTVRGEYDIPTPKSGARCITALADGRCSSANTIQARSARLCSVDNKRFGE